MGLGREWEHFNQNFFKALITLPLNHLVKGVSDPIRMGVVGILTRHF